MSEHDHDELPYNQTYINAWTILSAIVGGLIFLMLAFNHPITHFFHWVWDLLRWICRPII
jgi:hypothetical protein